MTLARIRARRGDCEQARQLFSPIYDQFAEAFETHDLKAAAEMLRELDRTHEARTSVMWKIADPTAR